MREYSSASTNSTINRLILEGGSRQKFPQGRKMPGVIQPAAF